MPKLRITRRTPATAAPQDVALTFTGGLSQPVPLPGSALVVRVRDADAVGSAWTVEALAVPAADPGALAARLALLGEPVLLDLFGAAPAEPYRGWRNLWDSDRPLPERLGAVLLALARRTDATRRGGAP